MPIQYINTGSSANAGNGDSIRLAFDKVNRNFSFVDTSIDALSNGYLTSLHIATTASIHNLTVTGTTHLNTVESATFLNQTYFENITVSNTSTLNLVTANDAKIDTLEVLTSLSVGNYQIAAINDYNDFSIIKNDATGLAVVLLNTNADSNSKLIVKDNISGGLVILHQNLTNLAGDFVPGENYIYGETPTDVIHIGAYSDIKFSASEAKYYDPLLPETPSMVIQSIDGTVHVYSSATFHSDVYGIAGAGANAGTLDRLTSQDLSKVVILNNNGSLVPSADLTYDLGSTSSQWRSLYVGTSTIYLGGTALSVAGNTLTIDGEPIQAGSSGANLGKFVIVDDPGLAILSTTGTGYDIVIAATQGEGAQYISIPNNENAALGNNLIIGTSTATSAVQIQSYGSSWIFDSTGTLILPNGQSIGSGSLDGIKMTTDRGTVLFGNSPECVPTLLTHFHIMKEDPANVDLFLGDDNNYVKLPGDGETAYGVEIGTNVGDGANTWRFGTDGTLTAPGHLLPNTDLSYDLGSTTTQWRSIYVGTGTIYIGGVALGVNQDNYVTVDGNPIITINTAGNLTIQGDVNIGTVTVSSTAPTATTGTQWFDTVEGRTYVATGGVWLDASPTQIPSPETYLDGLAIDGTVIGTANVNGDAIVIDGGDNTKLTVSNNSVTIQVPGSLTRPYWAAEFGGITTAVTTSSAAIGTGAFYDSQGNVYVLGGVQFDSNEFFGLDSLLLKYDTNGNLLWSRTWHDDSGANCGAINQAFAIDSNDRIYWLATAVEEGFGCWTGYMDTEGNLGLGGVAQGSLGFLDGNFAGADIACDNSGNYYLAGVFFDYINNTETPVVIKVDGDSGVPIWTGSIIPEDFESLPSNGTYRAVTVNPATGDVWAIGDYYDGGLRAMLSKWDINGSHQWTKELVTTTGDVASAVIYNGGYVYTIVNDDPDQKAVVSKFDTDGVLIWASFLAVGALDPIPTEFGSYSTGAYDLSFDASGNVYVTGTIPGPPAGQPQLWITKLDPANGEMLYSRMLATTEGSIIIDQGTLGSSLVGHRVGDIYQDTIVVTAITPSDIDDSTGTNALRVMVAQLPIDGSVTGTFDNIDIIDITSDIDGICSTGTYTVTTLVWSTGTSTAIYSTSSISVSYVTDVIGLTGETIILGSGTASGTTTTNTWTFVNNNIILPPGGDILDSNGVSVLGATTSTTANGWQLTSSTAVVSLTSDGTLTLPDGGVISEVGGAFSGAIRLEPWGASSSTQALVIYPTVSVDGNHIHLTAGGGGTDLYLGDDDQYVKVDHSGTVVIGTVGATTSTWTFGTDGVLTLSTASTILGNSTDPNVYIETATTSTTSTWTFGSAGRMTFPTHTVPTTSHGAPGDKAGMLVFDSVGMYYCTSDFVGTSTEYNVTINSSQPTWLAFAKSSYPNALADFTVDNSTGWTVTYDGSTYNITSMDEYNGSYWRVYWAETITIVNADPAMITRLDAHIWVRQAWSSVGGWT